MAAETIEINKSIELKLGIQQASLNIVEAGGEVDYGGVNLTTEQMTTELDTNNMTATDCTDERAIGSITESISGQAIDPKRINIMRIPGGFEGFVDAIEESGLTVDKPVLVKALKAEAKVIPANHIDDHHEKDSLCGCGYCALRTMALSHKVFKRDPLESEKEALTEDDKHGVALITLKDSHVGVGFAMSFSRDRVLDPTSEVAKNKFFGLDLGVAKDILETIQKTIGMSDTQIETALKALVRNNMSAVFVLTNGAINRFDVLKSGDEQGDASLVKVAEQALIEFKGLSDPLTEMILARAA